MGKSTPKPPPAPDPTVVAGAQSAANIATAQEQQRLNQVGSSGPYGSVLWQADPSQPGGWTQHTQLSPEQQALYNSTVGAQQQALNTANQQIGRVNDALGQGFDLSGQPALQYGVQSGPLQTTLNQTPGQQYSFNQGQGVQGQVGDAGQIQTGVNLQTGFDPGQQVQGHIGPTDFSQDRAAVTDAVWQQYLARLDPQFNQQQSSLDNRLANQGIGINSAAYGNAQDIFSRGRNDAYGQALYQAVQAGANEQNTLFGQSLAQGQFANQAAAQQYAQNQGQAGFYNNAALQEGQFANAAQGQQFGQNATAMQLANQAAAQQYAQNLGAADFANNAANNTFSQNLAGQQFANAATGQQFQQDLAAAQQQNEARNQGVQEQAYAQNLPLNQFNSLMSSSQVQSPTGINYTPSQVAPTDVLGAYALNQQAQQAAYQARMQQQNSMMGGMFQLGAAALPFLMPSDRRLKRDIVRVGTWKGHNLYSYRYLWEDTPRLGVMADEVMHTGAVRDMGGWLAVDYGAL